MSTIGLIGGMSYHSTIDYYRSLNDAVATRDGGHHSARIVLSSVDFSEIRACQLDENWDRAGELLAREALLLERAGADRIAICTNLMHKVAPTVAAAVSVPLVHIADAVAVRATSLGVTTVGVLGTDWVMRESFYRDRLAAHGIVALVPDATDREQIDRIIWDELTRGVVTDASRGVYLQAIERLVADGAQAVVLACTEIQLLVRAHDVDVPLIDSVAAHCDALTNGMRTDAA